MASRSSAPRPDPAGNQRRVLLDLLGALRPHWHSDRNLPARIRKLLAADRRFGSRDRRTYRELAFTALRYLPWVEPLLDPAPEAAANLIIWLAAGIPETARLQSRLSDRWPACPERLAERVTIVAQGIPGELPEQPILASPLPEWFREHCPEAFEPEQAECLLRRAPLGLRLQTTDSESVRNELADHSWKVSPSTLLTDAWVLPAGTDVTRTQSYEHGLFDIQDLGSQLLLPAVGPAPGGRWLDACAGAGGKTLQLAVLLGTEGRIDAHDVRSEALAELDRRAERAGFAVGNQPARPGSRPAASLALVRQPEGPYDGVLVDAPCSGSGTWRRSPHLKQITTPEAIARHANRQRELLDRFSKQVAPGGLLVYATCSLSRHENQDVVAAFLSEHPEFSRHPLARHFEFTPDPLGGLTVLPARHDTDGYYVCALRRQSV